MSEVEFWWAHARARFMLTSDGKREQWDVSGPHFAGWEMYHLKGSPARPKSHFRVAMQRLVRADHSAVGRRRQNLDAARDTAG